MGFQTYYLYYALLGKIYTSLDRQKEALGNYEKTLSLTKLRAEQDFLKRSILALR